MRRGAVLLLLVATAVPASASEESQALSARGLLALNAGNTQEALKLFDRAVAADPNDAAARYQRGVTRGRSGDNAGAIEDLQAAMAMQPTLPGGALELGIALVDGGRYREAEPWLVRAQQLPEQDAQASFFLGITQLRLGRLDAAQDNFDRARRVDPTLAVATEYYDGVVAYQRHDLAAATTAFEHVQRTSPESAMGRESAQYIALIERAERGAYSAFGLVALEYDSNVTLGPNNNVPGSISGQGDGRVVINAGGRWVPLTWGRASLGLSYELFQSLQFQLTDFNLLDNRPAVQLQYDFTLVSLGLVGRYDYYLLDGESFLSEVTAFPWLSLREPGLGRTELYYRMQRRDYKNNARIAGQPQSYDVLTGYYNFVGARQFVDLGNAERYAWLGYQLGFTDPFGAGSDQYQYGAQQAEVGLRWPLPFQVAANTVFRYEHQNYADASACFDFPADCNPAAPPLDAVPRRDNDYRVIVSFERPLPELWDHLFLEAAYFGTWNDSNKQVFQYTRQIGSVGLEVRF